MTEKQYQIYDEFKVIQGPGFYRTRDGRKAEVEYVSKYGDPEFDEMAIGGIVGENHSLCRWQLDGFFHERDDPSNFDLVCKWREESKFQSAEAAEAIMQGDAKARRNAEIKNRLLDLAASTNQPIYQWAFERDGEWKAVPILMNENVADMFMVDCGYDAKRRLVALPEGDE